MLYLKAKEKRTNEDLDSMNGFEIRQSYNADEWDNGVSEAPNIFITSGWIESFANVSRKPVYFKFFRNNSLVGLIAGLEITPPALLLSHLEKKLHFFTGPATLLPSIEIKQECVNSLIRHSNKKNYSTLHFLSYDYPHLCDFGATVACSLTRPEFVINLNKPMQEIQKCIKRYQKQHIQKAPSQGWTFKFDTSKAAIERLIQLLDETRRIRLAKGYQDYDYYYIPYFNKEVIYNLLERNMAAIYCAVKHDVVHHAELTAIYGNRAYALLAGADPTSYSEHAGPFLKYNMIEYLHTRGVVSYNLGGSLRGDSSSENLIRFKMSLGAEEFRCPGRTTVPLNGKGFAAILRKSLREYRTAKKKIKTVTAVS